MSRVRSVPVDGQYADDDRLFIPAGHYLGRLAEISEFKQDGTRHIKIHVDKKTGIEKPRDAVILVFDLLEVKSGDEECDAVMDHPEPKMGKKVTDSLHEKADLYAFFAVLTGRKPVGDVDLDDMLGKQAILEVEEVQGTRQYLESGKLTGRSYIKSMAPVFTERRPRRAPAVEQIAPAGPIPVEDDDVPF